MTKQEIIEKWTQKYKKSIDCSNPKGFSQRAHCQGRKKKLNEDLRRWFKEKWVDISKKEDGKHPPCGREAASKKHGAYPKCRPSNRVSSDTPETSGEMSKKEKESAVRQKRRAEKKRRKDKKPHMTSHKDIEEANNFTPTKGIS